MADRVNMARQCQPQKHLDHRWQRPWAGSTTKGQRCLQKFEKHSNCQHRLQLSRQNCSEAIQRVSTCRGHVLHSDHAGYGVRCYERLRASQREPNQPDRYNKQLSSVLHDAHQVSAAAITGHEIQNTRRKRASRKKHGHARHCCRPFGVSDCESNVLKSKRNWSSMYAMRMALHVTTAEW